MAGHADILDQPERLSGWVIGSLTFHISLAGALIWYTVGPGKSINWGNPTGGGFGSVVVNPVARIPLPPNPGRENPVANDTKSMVPTPPPKAKPQPKPQIKQPDADAIPIKSRTAKAQPKPTQQALNKFREMQKELTNQVYSHTGPALSNPMYAVKGGGGVGVGDNSPFGTQFGWYAERIEAQVGQHWQTAGLDPRSHAASVVFTIHRDGSVTGVRLSQSSGNQAMDFSAQRAILDAAPFPPLPPQFPKSDATVELKFVLQ